jgi:hypothetical protein
MKRLNINLIAKIILWLMLWQAVDGIAQAQSIHFSNDSYIRFNSEAPIEDIVAVNKFSRLVLNTSNQQVAVKIPMKGFVFNQKLMQEHFNENYLESDKYPNATFTGIIDQQINWLVAQNIEVTVSGNLTLHGVTRKEVIRGRIVVDPVQKNITVDANFKIRLQQYNIKVPSILLAKIAEEINVNAQYLLIQK